MQLPLCQTLPKPSLDPLSLVKVHRVSDSTTKYASVHLVASEIISLAFLNISFSEFVRLDDKYSR